jgi:hypothetical protein
LEFGSNFDRNSWLRRAIRSPRIVTKTESNWWRKIADATLPPFTFNSEARCSKQRLTQPDRNDYAARRVLAWKQPYDLHGDSLLPHAQRVFLCSMQDEFGPHDSTEHTRSSGVSDDVDSEQLHGRANLFYSFRPSAQQRRNSVRKPPVNSIFRPKLYPDGTLANHGITASADENNSWRGQRCRGG